MIAPSPRIFRQLLMGEKSDEYGTKGAGPMAGGHRTAVRLQGSFYVIRMLGATGVCKICKIFIIGLNA